MNHPAQPITLYRFSRSGHSHRAELFLSLLGLPVRPQMPGSSRVELR